MNKHIKPGVYAITDCHKLQTGEMLEITRQVLDTGISMLQYRDKTEDAEIRRTRASELQALCRQYKTTFIINDDPDLARDLNADGIHLGKDDTDYIVARQLLGENAIIGVSCYDQLDRAREAQSMGANYVAFGSFYDTQTKHNTSHATLDLLTEANNKINIPVVAIGGINIDNGQQLVDAGADLLAVVSAIYSSDNPGRNVKMFNTFFKN